MYTQLVVSIDELWLKGKNKKLYLQAISDHILKTIKAYHSDKFTIQAEMGRFFYSSETPFTEELFEAVVRIPGISKISPCRLLPRLPDHKMDNVYEEVIRQLTALGGKPFTFRGSVKRNDQKFAMSSMELEGEIGHLVLTNFENSKVALKNFDLAVEVRVMPRTASVSTRIIKGIGGLPWGSTGSAITMLSGGFDSPVASYFMAKRGIKQSFVFFHAYPFVGREVLAKIKNLASHLGRYQKNSHLYIVPFGDIQELIAKHCFEEYRTLIFRRFMVELSNMICDKIQYDAIITGDCIGQVSSQTMMNLHLMNQKSKRMILRPLVGLNKMEILKVATQIGTHDISVIPHDDACALFAPKSPIISPDVDYWNNWDKDLDFSEALNEALSKVEVFSINLKGELYKKDFFSYDN